MTDEQVAALGPAFADYLRSFRPCFVTRDTFAHLGTYARGLLSDLPRKSVEPVALAAGCAVRTLQEFLTHHVWDHGRMRDELQRRVARDHLPAPGSRPAGGVGVVGWVRRDRRREEGRQDAGRPAAVLRRVGQGRQLRGHRPPRLPVWRVHGAARQRPVPARAHLGGRPRPLPRRPRPRRRRLPQQVAGRAGAGRPRPRQRRPLRLAHLSTSGTAASRGSSRGSTPAGRCTPARCRRTCRASRAARSTARCSGRSRPSRSPARAGSPSRCGARPGSGSGWPARRWATRCGRCGPRRSTSPATGGRPTAPTGWHRRPQRRHRRGEVLRVQRAAADGTDDAVEGRVHAGGRRARVPPGEDGGGLRPLRGPQLPGADAAHGGVPASAAVRRRADGPAAGGKTRR